MRSLLFFNRVLASKLCALLSSVLLGSFRKRVVELHEEVIAEEVRPHRFSHYE
jgi:hypothetical protein